MNRNLTISFIILFNGYRKEEIIRGINSIVISDIPKYEYEINIIVDKSESSIHNYITILQKQGININQYLNKKTSNESFLRNQGLEKSRGKYIRFLDDDDYFVSLSLYREYEFIKFSDRELAIVDPVIMYLNLYCNTYIDKFSILNSSLDYRGISNYYIKKSFIESNQLRFDEENFPWFAEDMYFFSTILVSIKSSDDIVIMNSPKNKRYHSYVATKNYGAESSTLKRVKQEYKLANVIAYFNKMHKPFRAIALKELDCQFASTRNILLANMYKRVILYYHNKL